MLGINLKLFAQQTITKYLSGTDKDHTVLWDFYCTTGHKSKQWAKIPVPSNWELQGFGTYNYFTDAENPDETGLYKYKFTVPSSFTNQTEFIVFEGSMTDTEVKINGKLAGDVHQGGYYRFKYDITKLVKLQSDNLLEVKVTKKSANASINKAERQADFWQFGGIFRPVYLEIVPPVYIDRVAIDAKADGSLNLDVYSNNLKTGNSVSAQLESLEGKKIGMPFAVDITSAGDQKISLHQQFKNIETWNPEFPHLYNLVISITNAKGVVHRVKQRFGFRTMELRLHDGIYVNNKRIIFKGVCRHSEWPESGRTLSKNLSLLDVKLMKEMNMNAVRMSHYPPDQHFLDVCDSLGLFVLDELTGWQAKYDTVVGRKLVKELVVRDVNHPSIVIWDNGNEGGWNTALDGDYALYDPQNRPVIHPWEKFAGTDTKHYPDYNYVANSVMYGKEVFFPTEFMHGNYDGGGGTALDDFWSLMLEHPYFAGGFLWSFSDEGVDRTDKGGHMDTANDSAPDGLVGPHREKEGSFYTVKEIWSPVFIEQKTIPPNFDGRLLIENRYCFTDLDKCTFSWKLVTFPGPDDSKTLSKTKTGIADRIKLSPGEKGFLNLNLPTNLQQSDALYLTATDPHGKEIFTWSWALTTPDVIGKRTINISANTMMAEATVQDQMLIVKADGIRYEFDKTTGCLAGVTNHGKTISLSSGPVLADVSLKLKSFDHHVQGDQLLVKASYNGDKGWLNVTWIFTPGKPVNLKYQYSQKGEANFMGITFNYPEDKITGIKWLGRGPYHIWKNRLKGQQFGIWHKDYNNTITGETWQYPEFKGYHSQLYWVVVENKESPFTVYTDDENMYLQMLKPQYSKYARESLKAPFPDGDIGFLNAISPMGTRFQQAALLGPQSQKNIQINYTPISGSLWFDFR
ncbi:MAG: glycoside hydrolase family 2 TIM barrel-domain containing protein [Mucilaginibacter sp.]|uniref:glycoside hydrolase family 2 protein n=1 Tax=Mucilaginibacter sp. TaxID=1882438 RepID=UPI003264C604